MLRLYTECQCPTMSGTGLKVCVGGMAVCKPILVFSFVQAEQFRKYNAMQNNRTYTIGCVEKNLFVRILNLLYVM